MTPHLLISSCLLGEKVKYNGGDNHVGLDELKRLANAAVLIPVCPEVAGGLSTPRIPAETWEDGSVVNAQGESVTDAFAKGAHVALETAREHGIKAALLKERSPSCGVHEIYDGSFSGRVVPGQGMTSRLLSDAGIRLFNENEISECIEYLQSFNETHQGETDD